MNIAVINIKDIIKFVLVLGLLVIVVVSGITIVKANGKEEEAQNEIGKENDASFLYCLELELPIMADNEEKNEEDYDSTKKLLDTQLAMLYNVDENTKEVSNEETKEEPKTDEKKEEEPQNKKIEIAENVSTEVIEENNITPSFTDTNSDIQVKNQSNYDVKDLIANANYQIKNKDKVVIYHTHTCESYTSSEKYPYEMTGAYRTTDLNYTVSKVRRWIRRVLKAIWKDCSAW